MKGFLRAMAAAAILLAVTGCATATGALAGAAIGSFSANAGKGALIGGAVGAVVDIVD
jgi:hypothetical protein